MNEEITIHWSRGDLNGEWLPSEDDIDDIFDPHREDGPVTLRTCAAYMKQYHENTFVPFMNTFDAYRYCLPLRDRAIRNLCSLPWDTNLLNAFHNLHFTLFMADVNPSFGKDRVVDYTVPAWQVWILQLIYHAASECLRDDFIKVSKKDPHNYRIATLATDDRKSVGMTLHLVSDICIDIWVDFIPKVNKDGTLGFDHSVELGAYHWNGDKANIAPRRALRKNMLRMKEFTDAQLKQFAKTLKNAEFNSPMYALKNINGGNL